MAARRSIGAPIYGCCAQGAAFVYTLSGGRSTQQHELTASDGATDDFLGFIVSLSGDGKTALIAAIGKNNLEGAAYAFTLSGGTWSQQAELSPSDGAAGDQFGNSIALSNDGTTALIGAPGKNNLKGAAYGFTSSGGSWGQAQEPAASDGAAGDLFGWAVALSGEGTALISASQKNGGAGAAYTFVIPDVSLLSAPSGRSFTLAGTGCPSGPFTTPYNGHWQSPCTVTWTSPDATGGTRYTFQSWSDADTTNARTVTPELATDPVLNPVTANFLTEYQLTTIASPGTGGTLMPQAGASNWYTAGSDAVVSAAAMPGFVFTGFTGDLMGEGSPQVLTMDAPHSVTGHFAPTPNASESGTISARTGQASGRQWTINITNSGPGVAYDAQLVGLMLTQTFGATACTPVRLSPLLPFSLGGDIALNATVSTAVTFDFSSCPANARFTVTVDYVSNGGASVGLIQLVNQLQ